MRCGEVIRSNGTRNASIGAAVVGSALLAAGLIAIFGRFPIAQMMSKKLTLAGRIATAAGGGALTTAALITLVARHQLLKRDAAQAELQAEPVVVEGPQRKVEDEDTDAAEPKEEAGPAVDNPQAGGQPHRAPVVVVDHDSSDEEGGAEPAAAVNHDLDAAAAELARKAIADAQGEVDKEEGGVQPDGNPDAGAAASTKTAVVEGEVFEDA